MKRSICSLLAILLLATLLLTSCKQKDNTTENTDPSVSSPAGSPTVSATETKDYGIPGESIVMTVGDFEINKSLFRYYYDTILANYQYEDKDFLEKTENAIEKVVAEALTECKKDAAYHALYKETGETLSEDWEEKYEAYKQETNTYFYYYYGISLDQYMEDTGMTEEIFKMFYLEDSIYHDAIQKYLTTGETPKADLSKEAFDAFAKDYVSVRHILVGMSDGLSTEDALKRANEMIDRYKKGEDFESLQAQYSNDYQPTGGNVYTFTYGEMVKEFEEASFKLKENEISEPIKTQYGYHVILRLPYPDDFNDTFFYPYVTEQYINKTVEGLTETKTELYDVMIGELSE